MTLKEYSNELFTEFPKDDIVSILLSELYMIFPEKSIDMGIVAESDEKSFIRVAVDNNHADGMILPMEHLALAAGTFLRTLQHTDPSSAKSYLASGTGNIAYNIATGIDDAYIEVINKFQVIPFKRKQ